MRRSPRTAVTDRPLCCHCGKLPARLSTPGCTFSVPLCWRCRADPAIRRLHPSPSKYARRGVSVGGGLPPEAPTDAVPGTPAKVRVLAERAATQRALWHPQDGPRDEQPPPRRRPRPAALTLTLEEDD
jgi:hypothetical protein